MKRNDRRIRILHITQATGGGVEQYIRILLEHMDQRLFDNILIASPAYNERTYIRLVTSLEKVEMKREIGMADIKAMLNVRKLIRTYHPDVVYAHSSKAGVIARLANIGLSSICIYNPHGWAFNMQCSSVKQHLYAAAERIAAFFCEAIICISNAEVESALKKHICKSSKLRLIVNGIDLNKLDDEKRPKLTRKMFGFPETAYVVGMVGRLTAQKAPDVFVDAAKLIRQRIPNASFILVGGGDDEATIRQRVIENGLEKVLCITGWVDNPSDYMEVFDVAMLLSRWEGFGLVLPEYMLAGKPIIATNVDAIPEIITDHENGILIEVDNATAVCDAVMELYKNKELCQRMVNQARKTVKERYDIRRVAKEHEQLIMELLSSQNAQQR